MMSMPCVGKLSEKSQVDPSVAPVQSESESEFAHATPGGIVRLEITSYHTIPYLTHLFLVLCGATGSQP